VRVVQIAAPFVLFAMMGIVGLELTLEDFRRVARYPRAVVVGTLGQLTLLPLASVLLARTSGLESHLLAGLVLIVAAPGGGISNVFTFLARAHTALSVTLTAVSSLLAVVTLPLLLATGLDLLAGEQVALVVPIVPMIGQLVLLVLLPIGLGMWLRVRRPDLGARYARPFRRFVLASIVLLLLAGVGSDESGLAKDLVRCAGLALAWTAMAMGLGWALARLCGLDRADAFTFLIEFSVKNVGLAAIVAISSLERPALAVFAGAYVLVGYPLAALAAWLHRRCAAPG